MKENKFTKIPGMVCQIKITGRGQKKKKTNQQSQESELDEEIAAKKDADFDPEDLNKSYASSSVGTSDDDRKPRKNSLSSQGSQKMSLERPRRRNRSL